MNRVLTLAMTALVPALEDVKLGTASTHGFRALFKYDGAKQYVEDILNYVATVEPKRELKPNPGVPLRPHIACAQPGDAALYRWLTPTTDPWAFCTFTSASAFAIIGSAYIFICPRFFSMPEKPPDLTGRHCPTTQQNHFQGDGFEFTFYQTYALIHELIHFYLQSHSLSGVTHPCEQYTLDGCVSLTPLHSLHNPTSYQTYISSKSPDETHRISCIQRVVKSRDVTLL